LEYYFLGVFNNFSIDQIKWRINKLDSVVSARFSEKAIMKKIELGIINEKNIKALQELFGSLKAWIIVQTENEKSILEDYSKNKKLKFEFFSIEEIHKEIETKNYL